ncbi:C4-type zinc ribbon domain-containing protein [uncultured Nocardioides sp.]|uniref:zinc ribbon domain-containing protein n=1 Tax=uncultured Nocardioides sp. TaxID=198441 RepID=UPI002605F1C3|nr:C4-type zinc ribbon domain-containing protein [uncultured Nocardioides sp.]
MLDVQDLDTRADRLRHRRTHLPELVEIAALEAERRRVDDEVRDARIAVDDLAAEQAKADSDVEAVRARQRRDQERLDTGSVGPKDLERIQAELVSLARRIASLEDTELEVMERQEEAQGRLTGAQERLEAVEHRLADLAAARDAAFAEIDAELVTLEAERGPVAEQVPDDLTALYERLRAAKDGVGAALLRARACGGCQLSVDAAELNTIRAAAPDEVVRCEECQRILVRTAESGL